MRILVLGSRGMIGNGISTYLQLLGYYVMKMDSKRLRIKLGMDEERLCDALGTILPFKEFDGIINCVGLVKQRIHNHSEKYALYINSKLPRLLAEISRAHNKKLIHISTDCVFSGKLGNMKEIDVPDAVDLYGRSKAEGENIQETALVVRTSTIGVELYTSHGLLSWYINQKNPVPGFENAIYNGLSLFELSKSIDKLLNLNVFKGLYNIGSEPVSKFDLLSLFHIVGLGPKVMAVKEPVINRTLNDDKFRSVTKMKKPNWLEMLNDIQNEVESTNVRN